MLTTTIQGSLKAHMQRLKKQFQPQNCNLIHHMWNPTLSQHHSIGRRKPIACIIISSMQECRRWIHKSIYCSSVKHLIDKNKALTKTFEMDNSEFSDLNYCPQCMQQIKDIIHNACGKPRTSSIRPFLVLYKMRNFDTILP